MQAFHIARSMIRIPRECLNQSPSVRDTEVILLQLKHYFIWHLTAKGLPRDRELSSGNASSGSMLYDFTRLFTAAIYELDRKVLQHLWKLINAGCEIVGRALQEQHLHLLVEMLVLFCDKIWAKFPDLRRLSS
jgi:hypothetical protein